MNIRNCLITVILSLTIVNCDSESNAAEPYVFTELAMSSRMLVKATNDNGSVEIKYLSPLEREYRWGAYIERRTLTPRKERWDRKLGAYEPAESSIFNIFQPRIVAEDSQLHFENYDEVYTWLKQGSEVLDWVYTDTGFVVGFSTSESRNQVNIEVYQIYINGEKPVSLSGSRSGRLEIAYY